MTTPIQHKIIAFIQQHLATFGYSPSFTEIAKGIGISPRSVSLISRNVQALRESGLLTAKRKGARRGVLPTQSTHYALPLLGRIAAGSPIEAITDHQLVNFDRFFQDNSHFMLEVKGNSMIEEKIFDGDFAICKQSLQAKEGDIAAVLIEQQEVTLKRVSYQLKDRITLIPANVNLNPQVYLPEQIQIQGIFVATIRFKK